MLFVLLPDQQSKSTLISSLLQCIACNLGCLPDHKKSVIILFAFTSWSCAMFCKVSILYTKSELNSVLITITFPVRVIFLLYHVLQTLRNLSITRSKLAGSWVPFPGRVTAQSLNGVIGPFEVFSGVQFRIRVI